MQFCLIETSKFWFYELKSRESDGQFIQLHQQVNQGRQKQKIFRCLGELESLETEKRLASGRDTQSTLVWKHCMPAVIRQILLSASERRNRRPRRLPSPPTASCLQLLHVFLKLNFIKYKKVTGHTYVKFYDLKLLFGTFFDISCRSRDISKKPFSGVVFCKIRAGPGVFGSCIFDHQF